MALIDKASLLMVPSTYEDGTLYNVLPSGNKAPDETGNHNGYDQTRADFTFSRGSNLAATRVNASGLIEKGRENLLFPSENTNTGWSAGGTNTYTSNIQTTQQDPNGSTRGFRWTATIGSTLNDRAFYRKNYTKDGSYLTLSFWVKSANGSNQTLTFHYSGGHRSTINVTNEWQRVEYGETNGVGVGYFGIEIRGTISDESADVYLYGWQLEKSLVATPYIETGATTATAGVLENTPRIDYSSGAGALLLESQRTNLLPHSEYINGWGIKSGVTATTNTITSPDGLQNASTIAATTSSTNYIGDYYTFSASTKYTYSVFVKNNTSTKMRLQVYDSSQYATIDFDQSDSVLYSANLDSYDFVDYGNGWRRVIISFTTSSGAGSGYVQIYPDRNGNNHSMYIFGAQLEAGSHVSSYVPTYGSAATRGADSCSVTGVSDVIGQSEGVVFFELEYHDNNETAQIFELHGAAGTTRIFLQSSSSNQLRAAVIANNGYDFTTGSDYLVEGNTYKIAFAYKSGDYALYVNGSNVNTSVGSYTPNETISILKFAQTSGGFNRETIKAKNLTLFDTRLTNTELATLTTL